MLLRGFEGWHLLIIAGLLVVLFGARKLPDSARSIGQSLRIFKSEMRAAEQDDAARRPEQETPSQPKALQQAGTASAIDQHAETRVTTTAHVAEKDTAEFESLPR